eukprot:SAG22_NODE_905_length_6570_cov_9.540411_3_plen_402_part_00
MAEPQVPVPTFESYRTRGDAEWVHPVELPPSEPDAAGRWPRQPLLTSAQVADFVSDGFIAVDNLWPGPLVARAAAEAAQYFPDKSEDPDGDYGGTGRLAQVDARGEPWGRRVHASNMRWAALPFPDISSGGGGWETAPELALNQISVHERALSAVAQLLGTVEEDLRLSQSVVRPRYGNAANGGNQGMHVDYRNNSLVVPPRQPGPDAVACLLYYSSFEAAGAPTHVAKAHAGELTGGGGGGTETPGARRPGGHPHTREVDSEIAARLYAEERPVRYRVGTAILYRLDAWHRATPVRSGAFRLNHHLIWRHEHAEWMSWQGWAQPLSSVPPRYMVKLSPAQRSVVGFPLPGDRYWEPDTVAAVAQRYPGMDMQPYSEKLAMSEAQRKSAAATTAQAISAKL